MPRPDIKTDYFITPRVSHLFPYLIPLRIPNFLSYFQAYPHFTLAPANIEPESWYVQFLNSLISHKKDNSILILRFSDGEFISLFGQLSILDCPHYSLIPKYIPKTLKSFRFRFINTSFGTPLVCSSGSYSRSELLNLRKTLNLLFSNNTSLVIAPHLTTSKKYFNEFYFDKFSNYLLSASFAPSISNTIPFYFVYAMLLGPDLPKLISGKSILIITSYDANKKANINRFLRNNLATSINWLPISSDKSALDSLILPETAFDIIFVAAGVGKFSIFNQLSSTKSLIIDVGGCLEIWNRPQVALIMNRPYTISDSYFSSGIFSNYAS